MSAISIAGFIKKYVLIPPGATFLISPRGRSSVPMNARYKESLNERTWQLDEALITSAANDRRSNKLILSRTRQRGERSRTLSNVIASASNDAQRAFPRSRARECNFPKSLDRPRFAQSVIFSSIFPKSSRLSRVASRGNVTRNSR